MKSAPASASQLSFLVSGGEMGKRIREFDWSQTSLGRPETWPQSLRSAVSICLGCGFPIAIYWGDDLSLLYNDAWSPIPAAKHPWALGHPAREVWPEIWQDISPLFQQVQVSGEPVRRSDQLLPMHRRGFTEECYFDYTFSPIRDEAGRVGGIFNAAIETTPRVLAERRAQLLRDLASSTVDAPTLQAVAWRTAAAFDGDRHDLPFTLLYLADAAGHTVSLAATSGFEENAQPGLPQALDLRDPASPLPLARASGLPEGEALLLEGDALAFLDGTLCSGPWPEPVARTAVHALSRAGGGEPAGYLVVGLSPRLAWDEEYRGLLSQAAHGVATALDRARAYAAERERAEKLAELDRAKTTFFSNVSHEFRTPLTLLLSPLEEIVSKPPGEVTEESRELATVAHRNALRLLRLVNALLDFSRTEAGRAQAHFQATDLARYTAELASSFDSAMEKAGLRFIVDCPPLPELVRIDHEMWEKVVLNLLSNAFKFTLQGEVALTLRSRGEGAELVVRDTGAGIPVEAQAHLFERFYRVQGAHGRTHEGSGIGLALVHELVRLHGGTVRVESAPGRGSAFIVTLPYGSAHLPAAQLAGDSTAVPGAAAATPFVAEALRWLPEEENTHDLRPDVAASAGRHHVLLADDNADMREYITRLLSPHFEVTAVTDGEGALAAVRARRPDLVLSDVMMPRLDGFGLLHALRADPATRALPVILLSARAGEEARVEGVQHGADDYLVKPFSARELIARVTTHLELGRIRAAAAEELRTSEERYRAFIANSSEGIWRLEFDPPLDTTLPVEQQIKHAYSHGRMAECNDVMARMYGLEKGTDLLGASLDAMLPQSDPAAREFVASIIRAGYRVTDVESVERDTHGNIVHFSNTMAGVMENGLLKRIWGTQRDISERHRAEEHVKWLADFPEQNPNPVIEVNLADNTIFYANNYSFERYPDLKELGVRHPFLAHLKGAVKALVEGHQQVMRREIYVEGSWYMQSLRLMPDINHVRLYCTDISALKRAETQLRENEETLRAARDVAEQASRAKDNFLAMLSHELRTPLTPVLMAVAALEQDTALPAEVRGDLAMMKRNIELETKLIDDLLDLNRITTGKLALEIESVDLNEAVRHVWDICRPQLKERGIRLDAELDATAGHVAADPARLQQVLWNVLKNAIKFTPEQGPIRVSTRRLGKDRCEVRVQDSGVGIPADMLPRIFDAFQQGDASITRRFGGLGLGLAICKALMDLHHGVIRAESAGPGRGSTFIIEIPGQVMTATTRIRLSRPPEKRPGPQLRLLVVDDHPDTLRTLTRLLVREGFTVFNASSVAEAVAVAEKENFDMLVSDIGLPDGDGHEVMRRIRALRRVPGIAMSGYGTDDDLQRSVEAGFSEHLTKPVEFAALQRAINRLAAKVSAGDDVRPGHA
ncbi:MAG: ATP-binding protein [Prosthecobacter sp.]